MALEKKAQIMKIMGHEEVLVTKSPTAWLTTILIALNVIFFLAAQFVFPSWKQQMSLGRDDMAAQRYWPLVSYFFMHANWLHIGMNMLALRDLGRKVELTLGFWRYAALYLIAGLASGLFALLWLGERNLVGASGAIFAVFAAHVFLIRSKNSFFVNDKITAFDLISCVVISLLPGISFAGHFGGFVTGWVLMRFFLKPKNVQDAVRVPQPESHPQNPNDYHRQ